MSVRHHFYLFVFALTTIHSGWAQSRPASDRNNPNGQEQRPTSDMQMPGMDHRPMPGMHMNMTQMPATFIDEIFITARPEPAPSRTPPLCPCS